MKMYYSLLLTVLLLRTTLTCRSNGSCGGCRVRAKARGAANHEVRSDELVAEDRDSVFGLSLWKDPSVVKEKQRLTNPNFLFHHCCEERRLPDACVKYCHFNTYDQKVLEAIYTGNDECKVDYLPEMQFCAAQGTDHRKCCESAGVSETAAGSKCLLFCDQRPDVFTPIDYSYAPCFERFEDMKRCFYEDVRNAAERVFRITNKKTEEEENPLL